MPETPVIETLDLCKSWGHAAALRGLNLRVMEGSIHGFMGRNGAGKTTTIKILLGMSRASSGHARVFGLPVAEAKDSVTIRTRTGFVGEEKELYDEFTVEEMIRFTHSFYPRWRKDLEQRYLGRFDLAPTAAIKTLSRGMRTKLALLLAFCRGAELLILDEPTANLDPAVTEDVLQAIVVHVAGEGMTVLFSSHQIAGVEQIADAITIIHRGRAVVAGSLDDVREGWQRIQMVFDTAAPEVRLVSPGIVDMRREGRTLTLVVSGGAERILQEARTFHPIAVDVAPVSLKEIFLYSAREENEHASL